MSLPEISRRCLSCGAAVRAGARFCPHCGQPVNAEGASAGGAEGGRRALERAEGEAPATRDAEAPTASDGAAPVTRDGAAPTTRDIEVPRASEPSASSPTTRD